MSDETMRACPFCGGAERLRMLANSFGERCWYYECTVCGATGPREVSPEEAAVGWNSRVPVSPANSIPLEGG